MIVMNKYKIDAITKMSDEETKILSKKKNFSMLADRI